MTYKELIARTKKEQKITSLEIRKLKNSRKLDKRLELNLTLTSILDDISNLKREFRHNHIAYCEFKNTPYEKIETPRIYNKPNRQLVDKIKDNWSKEIETVCDCT